MDSFKGSNISLGVTAAGTLYMEDRHVCCNGLPSRETKYALCYTKQYSWEEQSM